MASILKTYNSMGLPMNINRSNPIPVDNTELWYSLEDAKNYALNDPRAYVGQSIKVIDEPTNSIMCYVIGVDGFLADQDNTHIDDTLSLVDAAADAKAVGDAIANLNTIIATKIDTPESAEVGQVLSVKSVDENGNITWGTINSVVDAEDVAYGDGRLSDYMPVCLSRAEYEALVAEGNINSTTPYLIREEVVE